MPTKAAFARRIIEESPAALDVQESPDKSSTSEDVPQVTPSTILANKSAKTGREIVGTPSTSARRVLFPVPEANKADSTYLVTPQRPKRTASETANDESEAPRVKRRLIFGKFVDLIVCQPNVEQVYKIVRKLTGSIGGNGYVGPIYGELTMGSMQKMTNLMVETTGLDQNSRFIDVGSGIGKPNLHVAQYPGVAFSCGVEVEQTRWALGMVCLKAVLDAAKEQEDNTDDNMDPTVQIQGNTAFLHTDIMRAKTFDPFTHVYMFSIGFPPPLWLHLADMWNKSQVSEYLICYHGPKDIINSYEFDVDLIAQMPTSMHGSKEGHTGYIYKRVGSQKKRNPKACDALFRDSWKLVQRGLKELHEDVTKTVQETMDRGRKTRSRAK
eukprot:Nitzschia sp. Nitz4//scaffold77_size91520//79392//80540//NITZ4_004904-RA/size91520-processed-gene-0.57-mRNA-1//-1//CDS//3329558033//1204//frame0